MKCSKCPQEHVNNLLRMLPLRIFDFHKVVQQHIAGKVEIFAMYYESIGERILKIGPHVPKLLSSIKALTFLGHSVDSRTKYAEVLAGNFSV